MGKQLSVISELGPVIGGGFISGGFSPTPEGAGHMHGPSPLAHPSPPDSSVFFDHRG